jgi:TatD DNase family protein
VIDTHAHLDACADPPQDLLARARAAGVTAVLTVGSGLASCTAALGLARAHDDVYALLGVHPHHAGGEDGRRVELLRTLLDDQRAVAVGETGLDFFRDYAPRDEQRRVFQEQLTLAADAGRAVVVHCRAAEGEVARMLARFTGTVVLHCFSSPSLLPVALERGYYVSFAGNVTYPSAGELRVAAAQVPEERLLVETDSPYLAPQPRRGRPNEPANVSHTLAALAAVRGVDRAELEARTDANARAAFALP